jgi:CheY-like chemotaxis protein
VHLIVLDMHMPRLTGLETLRQVKLFKRFLPCIMLSAEADEVLVEQALQADAFSFLSKPVSRMAITSTVHLALHRTYDWPIAREMAVRGEEQVRKVKRA